jgi:hypothetical protein
MTAAGYSGTPLAKKLGIKEFHRLTLRHGPSGWDIPALPSGVARTPNLDEADVVVAFYRARAELEADVDAFTKALGPTAALWIAWPRRAGGHTSDLTDNLLRELLLPTGLVDVKVAALDNDWSGLKFVWRVEHRATLSG